MSSRSRMHGFPHWKEENNAWNTECLLCHPQTRLFSSNGERRRYELISLPRDRSWREATYHRGRSKHSPEGATCTSFHKKKIRFPPRIFIAPPA
jgi:hypothetical protein